MLPRNGEKIIMCTTTRSNAVVWHAGVFGGAGLEVLRMY